MKVIKRLLLIVVLAIFGYLILTKQNPANWFMKNAPKPAQKLAGQVNNQSGVVLGEATKILNQLTDKYVPPAKQFLIESGAEQVMNQIKKMPVKDQEEIKKAICK
jgi:hypothetical protein